MAMLRSSSGSRGETGEPEAGAFISEPYRRNGTITSALVGTLRYLLVDAASRWLWQRKTTAPALRTDPPHSQPSPATHVLAAIDHRSFSLLNADRVIADFHCEVVGVIHVRGLKPQTVISQVSVFAERAFDRLPLAPVHDAEA